jgi:hypothetical protein
VKLWYNRIWLSQVRSGVTYNVQSENMVVVCVCVWKLQLHREMTNGNNVTQNTNTQIHLTRKIYSVPCSSSPRTSECIFTLAKNMGNLPQNSQQLDGLLAPPGPLVPILMQCTHLPHHGQCRVCWFPPMLEGGELCIHFHLGKK